MWMQPVFDTGLHALRHGWRRVFRHPWLTTATITWLSIAAAGSVMCFYLLRSGIWEFPFLKDSENLFRVASLRVDRSSPPESISPREFVLWSRAVRTASLEAIESSSRLALIEVRGELKSVTALSVTPQFLRIMGAEPLRGHAPKTPDEVLISAALWKTGYQSAEDVVGRALLVEGGSPYVISGVAPPELAHIVQADLWGLWIQPPDDKYLGREGRLTVYARCSASAETCAAELNTVARNTDLAEATNGTVPAGPAKRVALLPAAKSLFTDGRSLTLALGFISVILLVGATLAFGLYIHWVGLYNRRALALRMALGATPRHLGLELVLQTVPVLLVSIVLGTALALNLRSVMSVLIDVEPHLLTPPPGWLILSIAALLTACVSMAFFPPLLGIRALWLARYGTRETAAQMATVGPSRALLAVSLVVNCAATVLGLVSAVEAVHRLNQLPIEPRLPNMALSQLVVATARYPIFSSGAGGGATARGERASVLTTEVLQAVSAQPGVRLACGLDVPLFAKPTQGVVARGSLAGPIGSASGGVSIRRVTQHCFQTFGMRLIAGRGLDNESPGDNAVISQSLAAHLQDGPVLGARIVLDDGSAPREVTVVGIVEDAPLDDFSSSLKTVFLPYLRSPGLSVSVVAQVPADNGGSARSAITDALKRFGPRLAVINVDTGDNVGAQLGSKRRAVYLVMVAAVCGIIVLLAAGVNMTAATLVRQLGSVIAIHLVMGATARRLVSFLIITLAPAALVGGLSGALLALLFSRWLYEVVLVWPLYTTALIIAVLYGNIALSAGLALAVQLRRSPAVLLSRADA